MRVSKPSHTSIFKTGGMKRDSKNAVHTIANETK
jgi:hypothetical protein